MEEIWKSVIGYEGFYEVSNQGRVRSVDRIVIQPLNGMPTKCLYKGRILKLTIDKFGYVLTSLSKLGKIKTFRVHRFVGLCFLPNPENKKTINHKDGNKLNNNEYNLEWSSQLENNRHANESLLIKRIKRKGMPHEVPIKQFDKNGMLIAEWDSISEASRTLNFKQPCISKCLSGIVKTSYGFIWKIKRESF